MKIAVDASLRAQAERYSFRFACDHCAHFDAQAERCSLAYVPAPRQDALRRLDQVELCKAFELA